MQKQFVFSVLTGVALLFSPIAALAHERQVFRIGAVEYLFVVGSLAEPVVVDDKTGVDLRIKIADPKDPTNSSAAGAKAVEGLDQTLKVEISAGATKKVFDLTPVYKDPGAYKAVFFPTVQTTLSYRFFGTINALPVDLTFTCNPAGHVASPEDKIEVKLSEGIVRTFKAGQFGCPMSKAELGFPEPSMTLVDLHTDVDHHLTEMMEAEAAKPDTSGAALSFGLIGVVLGALALWRQRTPKI